MLRLFHNLGLQETNQCKHLLNTVLKRRSAHEKHRLGPLNQKADGAASDRRRVLNEMGFVDDKHVNGKAVRKVNLRAGFVCRDGGAAFFNP